MSEVLYELYRPRKFSEVVGQEAVVRSLKDVLARKSMKQFLFVGPSGTGKTTLARIVAKEVGCEPNDIREISASVSSTVEDVRDIIGTLIYRPLGTGSTVKALIIDECQHFRKHAWDSLLKIIEEPPEWAYWFFCTTEETRVPKTIKTRCGLFKLKPVSTSIIGDLLEEVARDEKYDVDDSVIELCAKEARGSPRQALVNLAMCAGVKDRREAATILQSAADSTETIELARALVAGKGWAVIAPIIEGMKDQDPESIRQVVRGYVTTVILGSNSEKTVRPGMRILDAFSQPFNSGDGISPVVHAVGRVLYD